MYSIAFFKLLAELSLYSSFIVMSPYMLPIKFTSYIAMTIMALGQGANLFLVEHDKRKYRYISLIFPALGLISACSSVLSFILALPAAAYTAFVIIIHPDVPDEHDLMREFKVLLLVGGLEMVIAVTGNYIAELSLKENMLFLSKRGIPLVDAKTTAMYALIFVIAMAIAARLGRFGADYFKGYTLLQWLEYGVVIVPVLVVSYIAGKYWKVVLSPAGKAISGWLSNIRIKIDAKTYEVARKRFWANNEEVQRRLDEFNKEHVGFEGRELPTPKPVDQPSDWYRGRGKLVLIKFMRPEIIIYAVIAITLIILIAVLVRMQLRKSNYRRYKLEYNMRSVRAEKSSDLKKIRRDTGNRGKVRKIYRDFLHVARKKGIKITDKMTSEEILNSIKSVFDEQSAVALRDVYIIARYNEYADISNEQVRIAREALKQI
ncbi:MAG: hypothetical protein IJT81_02085 [Lachnospiraceae bacterium]|nr:hypothetical protein [Lachnospiraceae bacterium]